ncbi:hypothetical protein RVS70_05550 [Virgibacillus sp. M23]|uniref:hypothetical protein n=1 Tax=Virgibacillus sp. M23 TaxID=3079030 RepID=UPI002A91C306|nr:hypothetical protein [Virgibacillus sp. M23]MDY7043667.1 hypothetical protein [Virgibacillus sp. M23]
MRSYTNKKGETIKVSKEHLDMAVALKQRLQRDSPSYRCSWAKHKNLMAEEGFEDSENSENYRKMIQLHQKAMGKLPEVTKYADMVTDSKIESYQKLVGESYWHKRETQNYLREIRKGKRDIVDSGLFISEIKESIQNVLSDIRWEEIMNHVFSPIDNHTNTRLIAVISDWHIGALVDVEGNKYNLEIAKERINQYVDSILKLAYERKVYRIDVVYMGDILEHAYMRDSQAYHAEFPVSKQMTVGGRLIIEMLAKLATKNFYVVYRGFAGNHDRMNKDKNGNIDGDTGMVVVNEMIQVFVETSNKENLVYEETHPYSAKLLDVNGKNIKFVHGDLEKKADTKKIADHGSRDKLHYDAIVYGHFHHFACIEVGINRFEIRCGSTKGSDDYSEKLGLGSAPSQLAIAVSEKGNIEAIRIGLD